MKKISIGSQSIPLDSYVVSGTAILGTKGAGKTYAAKGIAEQLLTAEVPIIVFDAIGVWRHLNTAGDHPKAKGFEIVVAGGARPDLPLTPNNAVEIIRAAIRQNVSLVIDLYDRALSKADWRRIVQRCFHTLLYENVGRRHIFLEEAAEYAPQRVFDGETYAEVEKLVRMGGNASVGITIINQRAQEVNKAVLDLCDNLVLMRQRGSHAIDSLEKWVDRLAPTTAKEIAAQLPKMIAGECYVFSSSDDGPPRHGRTAQIRSYHPDRENPTHVARPIADTTDFVARMKIALPRLAEEQKLNDPEQLRAHIRTLTMELEKAKAAAQPVFRHPDKGELFEEYCRGFKEAIARAKKEGNDLAHIFQANMDTLVKAVDGDNMELNEKNLEKIAVDILNFGYDPEKDGVALNSAVHPDWNELADSAKSKINPTVRKILDAIHKSYPVSLSFAAAAARAVVSPRSSKYNRYREQVESSPEVERLPDGFFRTSKAWIPLMGKLRGTDTAGNSVDSWLCRLPPSYGKMLQAIADSHGGLNANAVGLKAGVSPTSSGLGKGLKELVKLQLVVKDGDHYRLSDALM